MAYGDYSGSDKPNKGYEGGACNRQRCQAEPANWWNHGSHSWYCDDCRNDIQFDRFNYHHWSTEWLLKCGHPQFETREQMNKRQAGA